MLEDAIIKGQLVDDETRCTHWHSKLDILGLKFACCDNNYWTCYECHQELAGHPIERIKIAKHSTLKVVICGVCKSQLTWDEYQRYANENNSKAYDDSVCSKLSCIHCDSLFNPGCKLHYDIYFQFD